ncbi:MAG: DoxX family membrane protein, partial [Cyclobacteriaceae bacterium]|nr:DoxX family membrane protein [Cyclobacteriaceae bacterium]
MKTNPAPNFYFSKTNMFIFALLRIAIGWHFLYEGVSKLFTPGWTSAEYLQMSSWIFAPFFHFISENQTLLGIVDFINIWGLIFVGVGLMLGILTRP